MVNFSNKVLLVSIYDRYNYFRNVLNIKKQKLLHNVFKLVLCDAIFVAALSQKLIHRIWYKRILYYILKWRWLHFAVQNSVIKPIDRYVNWVNGDFKKNQADECGCKCYLSND